MESNNINSLRNKESAVVFVVICFGLFVLSFLNKSVTFSESENRFLTQKPRGTIENILNGTYAMEYERYLMDQFPMRGRWIEGKVYLELLLQKQVVNGVYFGKDGYLIAQHTEEEVEQQLARKNVERLKSFLKETKKEYGITTDVMIVPTASAVLREKLPKYVDEYNQKELLQQVKEAVEQNGRYIPVAETLQQHNTENIFYRTDHHWTSLGAFYAYQEWISITKGKEKKREEYKEKIVSDSFLGTTYSKVNIPIKPDEITIFYPKIQIPYTTILNQRESFLGGYVLENLNKKDQYTVFLGGNNSYVELKTKKEQKRNLLIIKDSFAHCFAPFTVEEFDTVILLDYRYFNGSTKRVIEENDITDILVLYNSINFVQDNFFGKIIK